MVEYKKLFGGIYQGKKVLVTGHNGFKGSWLCLWLAELGADVYGYSLENSSLNHFDLLGLDITEKFADIRDQSELNSFFESVQPEIVFHLAAQSLVKYSYSNPYETFSTNVIGTLNVFEACRKVPSVKAIVNVTSDKCYDNREWIWGYRENDPMGGFDPYSASKGCSELLTNSYRNSYFNSKRYSETRQVCLGSARAGNVIGGGDWAEDRLIPDIMQATANGSLAKIRNPSATRPWQHVLEPLSGYLTLGMKLIKSEETYSEGWNFGPDLSSNLTVKEVVQLSKKYWPQLDISIEEGVSTHHEANLLMLDCSKANKILKWRALWNIEVTLEKTILWYRDYYAHNKVNSRQDLEHYINYAKLKKVSWAV